MWVLMDQSPRVLVKAMPFFLVARFRPGFEQGGDIRIPKLVGLAANCGKARHPSSIEPFVRIPLVGHVHRFGIGRLNPGSTPELVPLPQLHRCRQTDLGQSLRDVLRRLF